MFRVQRALGFRSCFRSFSSSIRKAQIESSSEDAVSFARIVQSRRSSFSFDSSRSIPSSILDAIIQATLRSPSGFNFSPYRLVLVEDHENKTPPSHSSSSSSTSTSSTSSSSSSSSSSSFTSSSSSLPSSRASGETSNRYKLANAMVGAGNIERVLEAPLSVVFVSDFQSTKEIEAVTARELAAGTRSMQYLRSLPLNAKVFTGNGDCATSASLRLGSVFAPLPVPNSAEAWAFKQVGFAAMSMLLAATANGVGSHAMEGFDARRVLSAIGAPIDGRWGVPVIISLGYPRSTGHSSEALTSVRPRRQEMVFINKWQQPK